MSTAGTFKRMGLRWKAELFGMEAAYGKFAGRVKFAGMMLSRAISAIGWLGLAFSVIGVLSQFLKTTEDERLVKFREEQERIAQAFKDTADEIKNVRENLIIAGDQFTNLVKRAKLLNSLDFKNLSAGLSEGAEGKGKAGFFTKTLRFLEGSNTERASDRLTKEDKNVIKGIEAQMLEAQRAVGLGSDQSKAIGGFRSDLVRARLAGDLGEVKRILKEFENPEKGFESIVNSLLQLAETPQMIKNAGDEFQKGFSTMRTATTPITSATQAILDVKAVMEKTGEAAEEFGHLLEGGGLDKSSAEAKTIESMLGVDQFKAIMEIGDPEKQRIAFVDALGDKYKTFNDLELRMLNSKIELQTRFNTAAAGAPKILVQEMAKRQKVLDLQEQISIIEDKRALAEANNQYNDPVQQKVEDAKLENLRSQLTLAERISNEALRAKDQLVDTFSTSMTSAINGLIQGTMTLKDAFKSMAQAVLQQLAQILAQMMAMRIMGSFFPGFGAFMGTPARQGGIMKSPGYRAYADGGVASGPSSGYPAMLHGTEAVVPLPNGRSIPVEMSGAGGQNNVTINVDAGGNSSNTGNGEQGKALGIAIQAAVMETLQREQRPGGVLGGG